MNNSTSVSLLAEYNKVYPSFLVYFLEKSIMMICSISDGKRQQSNVDLVGRTGCFVEDKRISRSLNGSIH